MATLDVLKAIVTELEAADLDCGLDPRDINPPGVLVIADALVPFLKLCRRDDVRVSLLLLARDSGDETAYEDLDELYSTVSTVLGTDLDPVEAPYLRWVLPNSPTQLPALRLTLTRSAT